MYKFLILTGLIVSSFSIGWADPGQSAKCKKVILNIGLVSDLNLIDECIDFYWHHGEEESPPGSFNNTIKLGYRSLEIDPNQEDLYSTMAWLLWSKWDTWHRSPQDMPDGELKAQEAVDLLISGTVFFIDDANYHKDAADVIWPLARQYLPQYYSFVIQNYEVADKLFQDVPSKVRVRLNLGHIFRQMGQKQEAKIRYHRVLDLDPTNEVAVRILKELEA